MALEFEQDAVVTVDGNGNGNGEKTPRLPRWTRQEILVLIRAKRAAESRGRVRSSEFGQMEPKWAAVSNYCKRHGVNRGAVQCRKRWSNLAGDYKKIKEWERNTKSLKAEEEEDETESFWVMRNDLRRERKLPGFFDREVYDIMEDGGAGGGGEEAVTIALAAPVEEEEMKGVSVSDEVERLFDRRQMGPTGEVSLFSEFEKDDQSGRSPSDEGVVTRKGSKVTGILPAPFPMSEKRLYKPVQLIPVLQGAGAAGQKQPPPIPEMGSTSLKDRKRKRLVNDVEDEEALRLPNKLIEVMERNGKMLADCLEIQNSHLKLDREQRKEHSDSLIAVLNKFADAFIKIADKL